jgi:hypothetical protein
MRQSMLTAHLLAAFLMCLFLGAPNVWGQAAESGGIVGTVVDSSGTPMPDVKVTLTSPALQVPQLTTTTDATGSYKFVNLPAPGIYRITFEREGFQTFVRSDFNLTVGFSAKIDAQLNVGAVTQSIEVTGVNPVIDTVNTSAGTTIQRQDIEDIPKGALIQEMIPMVAGLNLAGKPDVGDSNLASRAQIITYGIPMQPTLYVEGLNTDTDHSGNSSDYLDAYSLEEVEFKTTGNNADVPFAGAAQVAVMKSGSNSFHGSVLGDLERPSFQSTNITSALAGPPSNLKFTNPLTGDGYWDWAADFGGRIIRDKLWFYGGYSKQTVYQQIVGFVGGPGPTTGANACTPVTAWVLSQCPSAKPANVWAKLPEYNAKLSYQATSSIRLIGSYQHSAKLINDQGESILQPLPTNIYQNEPSAVWKAEIQIARPHWVFEAVGGFAGTEPAYIPQPASEIGQYGFTSGAGIAGDPPEEDLYNKLFTGTNDQVFLHIYDRHEMTETFSWLPSGTFLGGSHQLKFGTTWDWEEGDAQVPTEYPSGDYLLIFNSPNAAATTPTPFEFTAFNYPVFPRNLLHAQAAFVTDTWRVSRNISINLGVRWERYNSFYPTQHTTANQFSDIFPAQTVPNTNTLTWTDVVPRAGVAWDIRGNGKTVVKASFGEFGDTMGFLYSNLYNPESIQSKTFRWSGPCGPTAPNAAVEWQCDVTPGYLATLPTLTPISQTGGTSQIDNKQLKEPKTFEYHAEVERQLFSNVSLRVGYVQHRIYDLFDSQTNGGSIAPTTTYVGNGINVGHPYASYTLPATFTYKFNGTTVPITIYTYPAGSGNTSNEFLNTPSSRPDVYNTFEVAVTKRYSSRWTALASFWVTKDHRWIEGLAGLQGSPNDNPFNIDNTWNWEARGSMIYRLPWGFSLSSLFRATSGTYGQLTNAFSGTGTNGQVLNQGSVTMRLGTFGQFQGPVVSVLNFKVAKQFRLKERFLFEPNFQVFNLLNTSAAVTTSYAVATFGAVSNIVSPRVFRLGGTFSF